MKVLYKVNDLGYHQCMNKKEESKKTSMELAYLSAIEKSKLHRKLDEALEQGHQVFLNVVKVKPYIPNDGSKICVNCNESFLPKDSPLNVYCSYDCQTEQHLNQNKNPFTKTSIKEKRIDLHPNTINHRTACSYDEVHLPEDVAMYLDSLPDEPFTSEDERYLYNCIIEELPQAKYADGTIYQSELPAIIRSYDQQETWHTSHQAFIMPHQSHRAYLHRKTKKDY